MPEPQSSPDRRWWAVWRGLCALALGWLLACAWLARPLPSWPAGWTAWWSGAAWEQQPGGNFTAPQLGTGVEIAAVDGAPAIRAAAHTWAELGRLPVRHDRLTLAGWVKVTGDHGAWPAGFLVVRTVEGDRLRLQVGFENGHAAAKIQLMGPQGQWVPSIELVSSNAAALNRWQHLAFSTDSALNRLTLDGTAGTERRSDHAPFALARLEVSSWIFDAQGQRQLHTPGARVEHDDLVLWDRSLAPEEVTALARQGRGAWRGTVQRPELAARIWRWGWPVAVLLLGGTLVVRLVPRLRDFLRELRSPGFRPIRWVLAVGLVVTALLAGVVEFQGIKSDYARLTEQALRLAQDSEGVFARLDVLLRSTREWVRAHPTATHDEWRAWLATQAYPDNFPGILGLGYAQQVLPGQLAAHEAEWSRREGFPHRVQPADAPRQTHFDLAGEPRLPVVRYVAKSLSTQTHLWLTNGSILGHDLLFQRPEDNRPWSQARRIVAALRGNVPRCSSVESIAPASWYGAERKGLRLFLPVVTAAWTNAPGPLPAEAWQGVVFASIDAEELARERMKASPPLLGYRVFTGDRTGVRHDLLVDTGGLNPAARAEQGTLLPSPPPAPFYDDALLLEPWLTELFTETSLRKWTARVAVAGVLVTGLMAALLFGQIRAREAQAKLIAELRDANVRLEQSQRERAQLSRDLHDGTIQNLYAVGLHLQHARRHLDPANGMAGTGLDDGQQLVQDTIVELREFLVRLQEERVSAHSFAQTVEGLLVRLRRTTPVEFELAVAPTLHTLPPRTVLQLVNVVREAVSNALRHAQPQQITVTLRPTGSGGRLEIADDGAGFEVANINGGGYGLQTMRDRAAELGGRLTVTSAPGQGTTVCVDFPWPATSATPSATPT